MSPTEVSLPRLLALAAGLLAAACGASSSGSTTETARLLSVSPAGGSVSSSTTPTVMIRFSSAMKSGMEQYVDLHDGTIAGPIIPMHCTMAADRTAISCTPDHPLAAHGTSILHIGAGMMDADGRMVSDSAGLGMGGSWLMAGMMNGGHAGQQMGMMSGAWLGGNNSYGMTFPFTTN